MPELIEVAVAQLELDPRNPRLGKEQGSQLETAHALAAQQGARLVNLAAHIIEHGIDPTTLTAVVALPGRGHRYKVLEGNRRVLALKALDSPSLVVPAFEAREVRAITRLAKDFAKNPIHRINCIRFDTEEEAQPWVELRHTGSNGAGLVEWTAEEKRRYEARFGPGGVELQVLDFVKAVGGIDADAQGAFITNIHRALMSAKLQAGYGIRKGADGRFESWYPADEIRKPLTKLVNDMASGAVNSRALGGAAEREAYLNGFKKADMPDPKTRLDTPVPLDELASTYTPPGGKPPRKKGSPRPPRVRTALIPRDCTLNPTATRVADLVRELRSMNVNDYPNACSVSLRVLLELGMDDAIEKHSLTVDKDVTLAKKIKTVVAYLEKQGLINAKLKKAMEGVANSRTSAVAAGVVTWHQYVHNHYVHPKPTELRTTWDELQPFLEALWA